MLHVPFSVWCILAAGVLPILAAAPAKFSRDFSNAYPRDPAFWASGFRARAAAAQANGFEAFPLFAISVIVGLGQGGDPAWIDRLAGLFIGLRVIYIVCYWTNRPSHRSLVWALAFLTTLAIFSSPVWS